MLTNDHFGRRTIVLFLETACVLVVTGINIIGFVDDTRSSKTALNRPDLSYLWIGSRNVLGGTSRRMTRSWGYRAWVYFP